MLLRTVLVLTAVNASNLDLKSKLLDPAWHDVISEGGLQIGTGRARRFVTINQNQKNATHQPCMLPDGKPGRRRHLRHCVQDDFKNDFVKFLDYICIIDDSSMGACCPENAKRGGIEGVAGELPATALKEESDDASLKVINAETRGCGISTRRQTPDSITRIVVPREWPWMVSVTPEYMNQNCGGSLITERHVLTAAHCVVEYKPEELVVRLGEYDFKRNDDTRSYDFNVAEIHVHEFYESINNKNDIAIVKMHQSCMFNTYVWPICLPPPNLDLAYQNTTLIGWGTQMYGGPTSNVLQEVSMPVWEQQTCINALVDSVFDENLCAGAYEGGRDACQFDSGGPLMYHMPSGRWTVVGVVSWGLRCGEPNHPGVYVRVDKYLPWIMQHTGF